MRLLFLIPLVAFIGLTTACAKQELKNTPVVEQTYIHKYGVAVPSEFWAESGEDGVVVSTMADGVVVSNTYAAGILNGETSYSFPHSSQLEKTVVYSNGVIIREVSFFFDGTPKQETIFESPVKDSANSKTISSWYLNGTPRSAEQYVGDLLLNGEYYTLQNQPDASVENYEGTRLVRDDYGQLLATDTIRGGQLTMRNTYHANGSPKENISYQNGLIDGSKQCFHPAGEPNSIENWSAGQQHGVTVVYLHGEKYAEVPYENGLKNGIEKRYRDGTVLVQEITWEDGQLHGPTKTYVGESVKTDWYYEGKLSTKTDYERMAHKPVVR